MTTRRYTYVDPVEWAARMPRPSFRDLVVFRGNFRVTWEHTGEGWGGDYNPGDSQDAPLLRFSCDRRANGEWEALEDGSYCTGLPIWTPEADLRVAAEAILDEAERPGYKHRLELLSWLSPADFADPPRENSPLQGRKEQTT
jgi:hypothetical protein